MKITGKDNTMSNVGTMSGCVGCGLCADVCPAHAITMGINRNGYITPQIDVQACINCGLCVKKCIVSKTDEKKCSQEKVLELYAAWNKDEKIMKDSSSGGVFSALAELVLKQGGCIFGVKWKDKYSVVFAMAENLSELAEMRNSKYIQAFPDNVYQKVRQQLRKGRRVLFTGTPCQVHALNQFLGKKYDNLITVDIVCHGMPSHHAFRLYVDEFEAESGKSLSKVNFRDKIISWNQYSMVRHTDNGEIHSVYHRNDDYMRLFLSNRILNDTCYECPFTKYGRQGDITMGDFWGVARHFPQWNYRYGRSVVLANTTVGLEILKNVKDKQLHLHPITKEMARQGYPLQFDQQSKTNVPSDRNQILEELRLADSLSTINSKALGFRHLDATTYGEKNVALFGYWYGHNYGAQLTSLALYKQLEALGWRPTLVNFPHSYDKENRFLRSMGVRFTQPLESYKDYISLNQHFSSFVIGSDQLWRYLYNRKRGHFFYLDFVHAGKRRISYGTSIGTNPCQAPDDYRKEASYLLRFFTGVSSREREGVEVLKKQYQTDAAFVLDPVFLCSTDTYRQWAEQSTRKLPEGDYVCSYIMDPDDGSMQDLITYISQREQAGMINMLDANNFDKVRQSLTLDNIIENLTTEDWLFYIINCKHFITNSFHGLCFALMFNKPFTVVGNEIRGNSRFTSILNEFGMGQYLLNTPQDITRVEQLPPVDWNFINKTLNSEQKRSLSWLKNALEKPINPDLREAEEMYQRYYTLSNQYSDLTKLYAHMEKKLTSISQNVDKQQNLLKLLLSINTIKWKYYRYRILSKIMLGKARKKYKRKKRIYHELLRNARQAKRILKIS